MKDCFESDLKKTEEVSCLANFTSKGTLIPPSSDMSSLGSLKQNTEEEPFSLKKAPGSAPRPAQAFCIIFPLCLDVIFPSKFLGDAEL